MPLMQQQERTTLISQEGGLVSPPCNHVMLDSANYISLVLCVGPLVGAIFVLSTLCSWGNIFMFDSFQVSYMFYMICKLGYIISTVD